MPGFNVKTITQEDAPRVIAFLYKSFFIDEPLNEFLKIVECRGAMVELEEYANAPIKYNCSLIATNDEGETIGVSLNKIRTPNEGDIQVADPIFLKIAGLLGMAETAGEKIFEKFNVDKVMQIDILSVDKSCRNQGIAKKLIDLTRNIAKEAGIKILRVDCTNAYSAKAAKSMGFHSIYEKRFRDYTDNEGKQIVKPKEPHTSISVWIQNIEG